MEVKKVNFSPSHYGSTATAFSLAVCSLSPASPSHYGSTATMVFGLTSKYQIMSPSHYGSTATGHRNQKEEAEGGSPSHYGSTATQDKIQHLCGFVNLNLQRTPSSPQNPRGSAATPPPGNPHR